MSQKDENDLIRRAQAGDREAFVGLYDRHQSAIYTYFYYRVSDQATAEELTGEVFCRMVESIHRYQQQGKPILAWLYAIARNLVADHHRQSARGIELPLDERLQTSEGDPVSETEEKISASAASPTLAPPCTSWPETPIAGWWASNWSSSRATPVPT